jgi:hypothetical protein
MSIWPFWTMFSLGLKRVLKVQNGTKLPLNMRQEYKFNDTNYLWMVNQKILVAIWTNYFFRTNPKLFSFFYFLFSDKVIWSFLNFYWLTCHLYFELFYENDQLGYFVFASLMVLWNIVMIYCMFPREPLVTNIMWRNLLIQVCVSLVASTYVTVEESSCHKLCVSVVCHAC